MLLTAPSHAACGDDLLFVRFREADIARASGACAFGEHGPRRSWGRADIPQHSSLS